MILLCGSKPGTSGLFRQITRCQDWQISRCPAHVKRWYYTLSLLTDSPKTLSCSPGTKIQLFSWTGQWQLDTGRLQGFPTGTFCGPSSHWQMLFSSWNVSQTELAQFLCDYKSSKGHLEERCNSVSASALTAQAKSLLCRWLLFLWTIIFDVASVANHCYCIA